MAKGGGKSGSSGKSSASAKTASTKSAPAKTTVKTGRTAPPGLLRGGGGTPGGGGQPFIPSTGVPGDQGQMGKFRSDIVTLGPTKFSTGNPAFDKFLNEIWLPLAIAEAESFSDPMALLNSEVFKNIKNTVNQTYGPAFQQEIDLISQSFERQKKGLIEEEAISKETIGLGETRAREVEQISKDRIARNYSQALEESKASFASRGLAFSGIRGEAERRLQESEREDISDTEKVRQQTLENLDLQKRTLGLGVPLETQLATNQFTGTLGRSLGEFEATKKLGLKDIEDERTIQEFSERERLRSLGSQLLQKPEFL